MVATFALVPQVLAAQPAPCDKTWPIGELHLQGQIDGAAVRVSIAAGHPAREPNRFAGVLIYPDKWSPVLAKEAGEFALEGAFTAYCDLAMREYDPSHVVTATWTIRRVDRTRLEVVRSNTGNDARNSAANFTAARPVDCTGRASWREFRSPEWPVTFEYPADWRLVEHEGALVLQCPDPSLILVGGRQISLEQGVEPNAVWTTSDGRTVEGFGAGFLRFPGGDWWYGDFRFESCEKPPGIFCSERPSRSTRRGMTVLVGGPEGEHRLYWTGGYLGQGPGLIEHLFWIREKWVALQTDAGYQTRRVMDRVIRSIKPR
jgi:hypothetical protein